VSTSRPDGVVGPPPPPPASAGRPSRAPSGRRSAGRGALAGLVAGLVTVGVGSFVALFTGPSSDPLVAVGAAFVDATPAWLKDVATSTFGTSDKTALRVGEVVVLAGLAALAGVLATRRWWWGAALVVLLGAVAALAAVNRPDAGVLAPVPSILGAFAGLVTLRALLDRIPRTAARGTAPSGPGRRAFLQGSLVATAIGGVALLAGRLAGAGSRAVESARAALHLPAPARAAAPVPAGVHPDVPDLEPWATPPADFYRIDTALVVPQVDPARWSLRVHGLVDHEVTITWDELLAQPLVEAWVTLACVSNPVGGDLVGNQRWLGWPIRELLARAGPHADADMVLSTSQDGFTASTPIEALTDPQRDALLAVGMDGRPLPLAHGFPVRMVVPGLYGYVSATKWVVDLEVTRYSDASAYWTERGWSERGPIKTESRIDVPRGGAVDAGRVVVAGTAWAQHRGVARVQVRVDDGAWQDATLADSGGIDTWRQWSWEWDATPGDHVLHARAFDPAGPQTGAEADVVPDGATGYPTKRVTVRAAP
jgi:DMSO/TMAO reductase YedYZ molybdopterin-dependent catalytic subunit